jgi:hypothetical protein
MTIKFQLRSTKHANVFTTLCHYQPQSEHYQKEENPISSQGILGYIRNGSGVEKVRSGGWCLK